MTRAVPQPAASGLFALFVALMPLQVRAQDVAGLKVPPSSACWRLSFGAWNPPLNWAGAGHPGDAESAASRVRRIRDSVFVRDSAATNSNAMFWDKTPAGLILLLYPAWWPVGVKVAFDSSTAGGTQLLGEATALLGDASRTPSKTRARAWQVACG